MGSEDKTAAADEPLHGNHDGHGGYYIGKGTRQIGYLSSGPEQDRYAALFLAAPDLLAVCKEIVAIRLDRDRMRRTYTAGTCNAEDAWREFADREEAADAALTAAIARATGKE